MNIKGLLANLLTLPQIYRSPAGTWTKLDSPTE